MMKRRLPGEAEGPTPGWATLNAMRDPGFSQSCYPQAGVDSAPLPVENSAKAVHDTGDDAVENSDSPSTYRD